MPSSVLKRAQYWRPSQELTIEFHGGRTYVYRDVPPQTFLQLKNADSPGRYFNYSIRDRFPFRRV